VIPAGKGDVADRFKPGVTCGVVPEQDVVGPVTNEVTDSNNRITGIGAADLIPAGKGAIGDRFQPGIACRVVPESFNHHIRVQQE
jgi:hypothetical protein